MLALHLPISEQAGEWYFSLPLFSRLLSAALHCSGNADGAFAE